MNSSFLISGKNEVAIPNQYIELTEFILNREFVSDKNILAEFKNIPDNVIYECVRKFEKHESRYFNLFLMRNNSWLGR